MSSPGGGGLPVVAERIVTVDGVRLCVEAFGDDADAAVLLIAGMAMSMDGWDDEWCARLAAAGRYVVRYDHRDTGRSETWPAGAPGYTSGDLTLDALRVLDVLGITRAHVVGMSMGGGIAQELAARHPERVRGVTLVSTGPAGERDDPSELPGTDPALEAAFAAAPPVPDASAPDALVEYMVGLERLLSPRFDELRGRRAARRAVERASDPVAMLTNHPLAPGADGPPIRLADIDVPTLVVHGIADPMFAPAHGTALAAAIPGAELITLPGVGHEMPPPDTWDVVLPAVVAISARDRAGHGAS